MSALRTESVRRLTEPRTVERLYGPVTAIDREELGSLGFSGSTHLRLRVTLASGERRGLVLKRIQLNRVWTAYRTGDTVGREAALLGEPGLEAIWEFFHFPYLAYATEPGELALLMEDLGEGLLPDVGSPLSPAQEDRLLSALAALHARFWEDGALDLRWLTSPAQLFSVLGSQAGHEETGRPGSHPLFDLVRQGWEAALANLPAHLGDLLAPPAVARLARLAAELPRTLLHGDAKVANFALMEDGRVAAVDWAWIGAGPCTLDLGWYLAVNASRLARPKDAVIGRYRDLLERALGAPLEDELWQPLVKVGLWGAASMLIWEKALGLIGGSERANQEWEWWVESLERIGKTVPPGNLEPHTWAQDERLHGERTLDPHCGLRPSRRRSVDRRDRGKI